MQEPTVSPARPAGADPLLEHRDAQGRLTFAQGERGPEPGVAAADDRDVDLDVARERRRLGRVTLPRERLLQPPGRLEPGRKTHDG